MARQTLEVAPGRPPIYGADPVQRFFDGRFHRAGPHGVGAEPPPGEPEYRAPPVPRVVDAVQQSLRDEPLDLLVHGVDLAA